MIDNGKPFDWGRASEDYARYRDIYPPQFLEKLQPLCKSGTKVLDIGTGTGVIPRMLYETGAMFTGADASHKQIEQAKLLSAGKNIEYVCCAAEEIPFEKGSFDSAIACQCFWYFDHEKAAMEINRVLKNDGKFAVCVMNWLPFEDRIAGATESLVLKYNPDWTGRDFDRRATVIPDCYKEYFDIVSEERFDVDVPFTRESWNGRIKACRGVGAALSPDAVQRFEREHLAMLEENAPEEFAVKHFAEIIILQKRGQK